MERSVIFRDDDDGVEWVESEEERSHLRKGVVKRKERGESTERCSVHDEE